MALGTGRVTQLAGKRILITGGAGFLGRRVCALLREHGPAALIVPRSAECDLTEQEAVRRLFAAERPDVVVHLAAKVGGIGANQANPGRYFYANMAMGLHVIEASRRAGVDKVVQVGTVCAYPKYARVPFSEDSLWDVYPEETKAP
jgi:GDP-L-fucose synthase